MDSAREVQMTRRRAGWLGLLVVVHGCGCDKVRPPGVEDQDAGYSATSSGGQHTASGGPVAPPVGIARVFPSRGPTTGGTVLVVRGYNFTPSAKVFMGGQAATDITVADAQTLSLTTPPGQEGTVDVTVENPDGARSTFTAGFSYYPLPGDAPPGPSLSAVLPNTGPTSGGTVAVLPGGGFQPGAMVIVGGRPVRSLTVVSDGVLTATFPEGPVGTAKVAVTNPDGRSDLLAGAFAYYDAATAGPAPQVTAVVPSDGPVSGGVRTVARGANLDAAVRAYLGGVPLVLVSVVGDTLTFDTPPGRRGLASFAVTNPDGQSSVLDDGYNYFWPPPAVLAVEPGHGPREGGTPVTVRGRWFAEGAQVTLGGQPLRAAYVDSPESITGVTSAVAQGGRVDVQVVNPDGLAATLPGGFLFTDENHPPPTTGVLSILRVMPPSGRLTGGTQVTVFGTGFVDGAVVKVGGVEGTRVRVSGAASLDFLTPPGGAVGPVDVSVEVPGLPAAVLPRGFSYFDASVAGPEPTVSGVSPRVSRVAGGGTVAVLGTGFHRDATVLFGANGSPMVRVATETALSARVPPGAPGAVDVVVVNPDGRTGRLPNGFAYLGGTGENPPPTITLVTPASGPTIAEMAVTVSGTGFLEGAQLFVDGAPAPATVVSATQLDGIFPVHEPGTVDVTVSNPDGQSVTAAQAYRYEAPPAPTVTRVTPASGSVHVTTQVAVTGTGFFPTSVVLVDGMQVRSAPQDGTRVLADFPPHAAGAVDVAVVNPDGQRATLAAGFTYVAPDAPTVTSVLPREGRTDAVTAVTVRGTRYVADSLVFLGETPVRTAFVGGEELTAWVGPHAAGVVDVSVRNPDGQRGTLAAALTFVLPPAPTVTSVTPAEGPTGAATEVRVAGTWFMEGATVLADGAPLPTTYVGDRELTTALGPHAAGRVALSVRNPDGQVGTLANAFTFVAPPPPVVTGLTPHTGRTNLTTVVQVTGSGFDRGAVVEVGGVAVTTSFVNTTQLTAEFPPHPAGAVDVVVRNPDGQLVTVVGGFTYALAPPPVLSRLTPVSGPADGVTDVLVEGEGFSPAARVLVDGVAVSFLFVDERQVAARFPPHAGGYVDVAVVNPDGQSASLSGAFRYVVTPPTLVAVSPSVGPTVGNIVVLVEGTGFMAGARVFLGALEAATTVLDSTFVRAVTPASNPGFVSVSVFNPDGQSASLPEAFEYREGGGLGDPPVLSDFFPATGPTTGGTWSLARGTGFTAGMRVEIGSRSAGVVVVSPTMATVTVPPGAAGAADIMLTNPDGQYASILRGFTYVDPSQLAPAPRISGITPERGPASLATSLYVTGGGFQPGALFFVRSLPAGNPLYVHASLLRGTAEPQEAGPATVTVTNPDGRSASLVQGYRYDEAPLVSGLSPAEGPTTGGTEVLVSGSGFRTTATVLFGGSAGLSFHYRSPTLLSVVTPPGPRGPVDVRVVDMDGQSSVLPGGFTYVPAPSVTELTPARGPATGGTVMVVRGADFLPGLSVRFGSNPATVDAVSTSQIVVTAPAGGVGTTTVSVVNPDGQRSPENVTFQYLDPATLGPAPVLSTLHPPRGPATGGTLLALYGNGFLDGALFMVGNAPLGTSRVVGTTTATGFTGPGTAGHVVRASVTNPDGQSAVLPDAFTYLDPTTLPAAPVLLTVNPNTGSTFGGDTATAMGQGFTEGSTVFIARAPQASTFINAAQVRFEAGPGPLGRHELAVTTGEGQTVWLPDLWEYILPPPEVTLVNPDHGPAVGGTLITVTGRNFQEGARVSVGGATCGNVTVVSPVEVTCVTPPGVDGPAAVEVVNANGRSAVLPGGYTFVAAPRVVLVTPSSGPIAGGTGISVSGSYFRAGATLAVGGTPVTDLVLVSPTVITGKTPAGAAGPASVVVTNTDGQAGTLAGGFTYLVPVPPPSILSVSPSYGPAVGGTTVMVTGTAFQVGMTVRVGGNLATDVVVVSSTAMTCRTPGGAPSTTVDVTITNPDSQTATKAGAFSYVADQQLPPLMLAAIIPSSGAMAGGTRVVVHGRGIQNGAQLTLGGVAALGVQWLGPTALSAEAPPHAAGFVDVTVTNPNTQVHTLVNGFRYNAGGRFLPPRQRLPLESMGRKRGGLLLDFDGDGDSDLVLHRNQDANNRLVFMRNDAGWFVDVTSTTVDFTGVPNDDQWDLVAGDFDGDLDLDLFIVCNCYRILLRNDGGRFVLATGGVYDDSWSRCGARAGATGDVNGDGLLDVVVAFDGRQEELFLNKPATPGTFVTPVPLFGLTDRSTAIALADVDRDGDLDCFVANTADQQKQLYLNNGTGTFIATAPGAQFPVTAGNSSSVTMVDVNGDTFPDVVLGNDGQQDRVFFNNGFGTFTDVTLGRMPWGEADATQQILMVDVNKDGHLDMVAVRTNGNRMRLYLNDTTGAFNDVSSTDVPPSLGEYTTRVAKLAVPDPRVFNPVQHALAMDLTLDSFADVVQINEAAQNRLLENQGASNPGAFRYGTQTSLPEENDRSVVARTADLDGDGDLDIVKVIMTNFSNACWNAYGTGRIALLFNDGAGNFFDLAGGRMPSVSVGAGDLQLFDVDNDGDVDIFATEAYPANSTLPMNTYLFINDGHGFFTDVSRERLPSGNRRVNRAYTASVFDYDRDGQLDLVIGNEGQLRLWKNIGPGYFVDVTPGSNLDTLPFGSLCNCGWWPYAVNGVNGLGTGDVDGDGFPDILLARNAGCSNASADLLLFNLSGTGAFVDRTSSHLPAPVGGKGWALFDADGDSDPDAYLANGTDDRFYLNTGLGHLSDVTISHLPARVDATTSVTWVDADLDGMADIVLGKNDDWSADSFDGTARGRQTRLLVNVGVGNYEDQTATKLPKLDDNTFGVLRGDFNRDGKDDLFILNQGQSRLLLWNP
jgi:hypothetical protein